MRRIIVLSLTFLLLSSCRFFSAQHNHFTDDFPNTIGNSWTYVRTDNNGNSDILKVKIVAKDKMPDGQIANIWQYKYPGFTDSLWVVSKDTVANFYRNPNLAASTRPVLALVMPLQAGNSWNTDIPYGDTTKVLSKTSISVPAGTFTPVYKIAKTVGYVTNSWTKDTLWYKNKVGIVRKVQAEFNLGPIPGNGTWKLRSYSIH